MYVRDINTGDHYELIESTDKGINAMLESSPIFMTSIKDNEPLFAMSSWSRVEKIDEECM